MQKQAYLHRPPLSKKPLTRPKKLKTEIITITDSNLSQFDEEQPYFGYSEIEEELPDGITRPIDESHSEDEDLNTFGKAQSPICTRPHISAQIYQCIQNEVNYDNLTNQQIQQQKKELDQYIRFLNFQINEMVEIKQIERKEKLSQASRRANSLNKRYKEQKQIDANQKLILIMKNEYKSLKNKLESFEETHSKVKYERKIAESEAEIKKLRLDLIQRKRKNVLGEKKIIKFDKRDTHKIYFDLQQQYVSLSKKKESYEKKLDHFLDQNARLAVSSEEIDNKFIFTAEKAQQTRFQEQKIGNQEHNKLLYDTNKRRLELALKKRQREEEMFKKRYYELLKEYDNVVNRTQQKQSRIQDLDEQNGKVGSYLMFKKEKLSANSTSTAKEKQIRYWGSEPQKKQHSQLSESMNLPSGKKLKKKNKEKQLGGFLLTEPQEQEEEEVYDEEKGETKRKNFNDQSFKSNSKLSKEGKSKSVFEIRKFHKNKKKPLLIETQKVLRANSTQNRKTKYNYKNKRHSKNFHTQIITDEKDKSGEQEMFDVEKYRTQTQQIQPLVHQQHPQEEKQEEEEQKTRLLYKNKDEFVQNDNDYEDDFERLSVSGKNSPQRKIAK